MGDKRVGKYDKFKEQVLILYDKNQRIWQIANQLNILDWFVRKTLRLANKPIVVERTRDRKSSPAIVDGVKRAHNFADLTGRRFGKLVAIKFGGTKKGKQSYWELQCDCGNLVIARTCHLTQGARKSCGCARKEVEYGWDEYGTLFTLYKTGAKSRGLDFKIPKKVFIKIVSKNCVYCGREPEERTYRVGKIKILVNGIDRKDPKLGYVRGNVVPCCQLCNYMKSDHTVNSFLQHIRKIYRHLRTYRTPCTTT